MNSIKIRNDYKNLFIYIDIIALLMIISNAILNILNLGNVLYLYIATGVIIIMALFYFIDSLCMHTINIDELLPWSDKLPKELKLNLK